jgi:hypothetical protein
LVTILHLALAVFLFYAVNWIGKHSSTYGYQQLSLFVRADQAPAFNFILKTLTPSAFVILVATACFAIHLDNVVHGVWLVAVYYFGFRILYNLILGRALLLNWLSLTVQTVTGIGASYLAYRYLILPRHPLFPDLDHVGNQLWIILALFIYATFNSVRASGEASARRKNNYLRSRFKTVKNQYGDLIKDQFPSKYMELVAYAVMILETFNRPWIAQAVERAVFPWGSRTLGPMQVYSGTRLSDEESVRVGVRLLKSHFETTKQELVGKRASQYEVIRLALAKYNRDAIYITEVFQLLHILWAQVAPEYRTEFERVYIAVAQ